MIKNYMDANNIWKELISGVVFMERLNIYKEFLEYCKTKRYLDIERHEFGEFDDDAIKIVKDIEDGKTETTDGFGNKIEIWSRKELEDGEEYYLVRKPNHLFQIVVGKTVEQILKENSNNYYAKDRAKINEETLMYVSELEDEFNFTIVSNNPYAPKTDILGTVVFAGYDPFDDWDNTCRIKANEIINIIQKMNFMLGIGMLDLR